MSDIQQGPGWWMASDGKWYPPQGPGVGPPVYQQAPDGGPDPWYRRAWRKFRSWPAWAQAAGWFFLAVVLIGPFSGSGSETDNGNDAGSASAAEQSEAPETTVEPFPSDEPTPTTEAAPTTEPAPATTAPPPTTAAPASAEVLTYEERIDDDLALGAWDVCQQFIERQLTSPGSAEYPDYFEDDDEVTVTITRRGNYRVLSHVDSENGFGALLRTVFECTARHEGDDEWTLVDMFTI